MKFLTFYESDDYESTKHRNNIGLMLPVEFQSCGMVKKSFTITGKQIKKIECAWDVKIQLHMIAGLWAKFISEWNKPRSSLTAVWGIEKYLQFFQLNVYVSWKLSVGHHILKTQDNLLRMHSQIIWPVSTSKSECGISSLLINGKTLINLCEEFALGVNQVC